MAGRARWIGFVETNFYDVIYKAASGLTLYFSPSKPGAMTDVGLLDAPSAIVLALRSLERETGTGAGRGLVHSSKR